MAVIGQCRLCLEPAAILRNSHFLPKGVYKKLRDQTRENPNPWKLTPRTAVQTSKHKTAPLLCQDCEQRFSKNGENWVLAHCLQEDGTFPLWSILASTLADEWPNNPTRVYYASRIPEIDISALAYFAASMFWRGSIYPWNRDGSVPIKLGPFQEPLRQYLMGLAEFPRSCSLMIAVREARGANSLTHDPIGGRKGGSHLYTFPMPGLGFSMAVSNNLSAKQREICFVHGPGNPIVATTIVDKLIEDDVIKRFSKIF